LRTSSSSVRLLHAVQSTTPSPSSRRIFFVITKKQRRTAYTVDAITRHRTPSLSRYIIIVKV
jgi:hypothetical protein